MRISKIIKDTEFVNVYIVEIKQSKLYGMYDVEWYEVEITYLLILWPKKDLKGIDMP